MTPPLAPLILLVALGVAGMVAAAYLFRRAARGSRVGDEPHCAGCDYDLTGLEAGRCPECGGTLDARSIARGRRVWQPLPAVAGVALSLLMLPLVAIPSLVFYRHYNWYGLTPIGRVIDDAASTSPRVAGRAWFELWRRRAGTALSPAQRDRLAAIALAEQQQVTTLTSHPFMNWLETAAVDGTLTPAQRERFFRQLVRTELRVRKTVVAGDPVPFEFVFRDRAPFGGWWTRVDPTGLTCDGSPADEAVLDPVERDRLGGLRWSVPDREFGVLRSSVTALGPGRHTLRLAARVNVFYRDASDNPLAATPVYRHDVVLTAEPEVLAAAPADYVTRTPNPAMEQRIRAYSSPENFWWLTIARPGGELCGQLDVRSVPTNVAFDVFARAGGREYPLGPIALPKGESKCFLVRTEEPALRSASEFDLVLRTSETVARRTVDLYDVWDGEVVFPGVVVRRVAAAPR